MYTKQSQLYSKQVFKIIVNVGDNSRKLLQYLAKNVKAINGLGLRIHLEKISNSEIDDDMIALLKSKGITRLPAAITPDGRVIIGVGAIIGGFEKSLTTKRNQTRFSVNSMSSNRAARIRMDSYAYDLGIGDSSLGNYWSRELFMPGKDGRLVPRSDDEEDEREDFNKKIREYEKHHPRRHRGQYTEAELDRNEQLNDGGDGRSERNERFGRKRDSRSPRNNITSDEYDDEYDDYRGDSIASAQTDVRSSIAASSRGDNDMDDRMLEAWLANNVGFTS